MGKSAKKARSDRINALRKQYDAFLEEDKKRKERNEFILGKLDKMRYTTALVRHKPNAHETRLAMMDRIGYQPEFSPVRDLQPTLKTPSHLFSDTPVRSTEDALIQEISKKYILIPKLRTTFINNHNNLWNETASQIQNPEKLPERHYQQDTVPIDDLKLNPNENVDWKDKYEILNILKNEEKEKQAGNAFTDHKEGPNSFARAESFPETNQVPANYDRDRIDAMKVTEIPEKDVPDNKLYYGIPETNQQNMNAIPGTNTVENVELISPDHAVTIDDKFKAMSLDYEQPNFNNSEIAEEITHNHEPQHATNFNMTQNYDPEYSPQDLNMSQSYEPQQAANLNMTQNYESQQAHNVNEAQNYEPQDASNYNITQNYEPHDETNITMSQNYEPQLDSNVNITQGMTDNGGDHLTEENAYYQEEYPVEGDPSNLNNDMSAVQHEQSYSGDMVYAESNEVGQTPILDHTEATDVKDRHIENTNIIQSSTVQDTVPIESVLVAADETSKVNNQQPEPAHQEPKPVNEEPVLGNEQTNNFADMTEAIQEFDNEQTGMFYSESAEHYPGEQGDGTTLGFTSNEYAENQEYNYYENTQPEAYPVELNDDEITQRYDPHYEQQYAGVEEGAPNQEYQQYQEPETVEQTEPHPEVMQYDQQFVSQGMVEQDLDAEDGYAPQQNDFVVPPEVEQFQNNEFENQEAVGLSEPIRT